MSIDGLFSFGLIWCLIFLLARGYVAGIDSGCLVETPEWTRPGGYSSAGRALQWHCRGQRFDPA